MYVTDRAIARYQNGASVSQDRPMYITVGFAAKITWKLRALWEIIISMYYEIHILIVKLSNFVLVILLMVYLYCS